MVSVIHLSDSFRQVLNYNENKVNEGVADCIEAAYFLKDAEQLSFRQKLGYLQLLASKRPTVNVNCVHISLNFDPAERHSEEKLKEITAAYMDKLGFAGQPYLLYRHRDAGHPHVHIMTTNIRHDGGAISLHNLGKIHSEKARKQIEIDFNLVKAEDNPRQKAYEISTVNTQVEYGKSATKRAISNVLRFVLEEYKFGSLPELNAVLNLYNVAADQGSEHSRVFKNGGLTYRVVGKDGAMVGVPIKASDFYGKPTLKNLATAFIANEKAKQSGKKILRNTIDLALLSPKVTGLASFKKAIEKEGVDLVIQRNKDGVEYGLTYIDHSSRCVFKGSDLGKSYSFKGIIDRWEPSFSAGNKATITAQIFPQDQHHTTPAPEAPFPRSPIDPGIERTGETSLAGELLEAMARHDYTSSSTPYELSGKKKRRKKRRSNNNLNQ